MVFSVVSFALLLGLPIICMFDFLITSYRLLRVCSFFPHYFSLFFFLNGFYCFVFKRTSLLLYPSSSSATLDTYQVLNSYRWLVATLLEITSLKISYSRHRLDLHEVMTFLGAVLGFSLTLPFVLT